MFWEGSSCKLNPENSLFSIICSSRILEQVFGSDIQGIRKYVLLVNCSHTNELYVRILNVSIWTSLYQVMVLLPMSVQLDLVGLIRPVRVN